MKNLKKKIGVVVLSSMLLSGAGFAASSSVANAGSQSEIVSPYSELEKAYILDELVDLGNESNLFSVFRSDFDQKHSNFGDFIRYRDARSILKNIERVGYRKDIDKILGIGGKDVEDVRKDFSRSEFRHLVKSGKEEFHKIFKQKGGKRGICYRFNVGGVRVIIHVKS